MGRIVVRPQDWDFRSDSHEDLPEAQRLLAESIQTHHVNGCGTVMMQSGRCPEEQAEQMAVRLVSIAPGALNPVHHFSEAEVACVISGAVTLGESEGSAGEELGPGSVVYLDACEDFWLRAGDGEPVVLLVVHQRTATYVPEPVARSS